MDTNRCVSMFFIEGIINEEIFGNLFDEHAVYLGNEYG